MSGRGPVDRLALRREEAARALGMSVDHFDRHVRPSIPVVYCGELKLWPVRALERWLEERSCVAPQERHAA